MHLKELQKINYSNYRAKMFNKYLIHTFILFSFILSSCIVQPRLNPVSQNKSEPRPIAYDNWAESTLKHLVTGDPKKDWLIEQLRLRLRADAIQVAEEIGLKKNQNQNQNHHYQWKVPDTSPLYPSGRLIHLVQHHEGDGYIPLDVTNSRDRFGDMHLSRNMLSDHALKFYMESIDMGFRLK